MVGIQESSPHYTFYKLNELQQLSSIDWSAIKEVHCWSEDFNSLVSDADCSVFLHYSDPKQLSPEHIERANQLILRNSKEAFDSPLLLRSLLEDLERKLAISEIRSSEFIEKNYNMILVRDESGTISYINAAIEKTIGYKSFEILGKNSNDFVHPDDQEAINTALDSILQGEFKARELKLRIRHKEGHYVWIQSQISDHRETPGINGLLSNFINIDQQQKAILELEESNRRYDFSTRATQDVIWDWDISRGSIKWGSNLKEIFGYTDKELDQTKKFTDCIYPEDLEGFDQSVEMAIEEQEEFWESRYRFKHKNGEYRYILDRGYIHTGADGEVIRIFGAMHDETDHKVYEARLKTEEKKFKQIFEGSLIGMIQFDLDQFQIKDCNQALLNMLGYHKEEFLKTSLRDIVPENEFDYNLEQIKRLRYEGTIEAFQTNLVRKDQGVTKVIISASSSQVQQGTFAWVHILDLGPIERSTLALAEAENRFRQYIEKSSDIFITLNESGKFSYISPNIEQILGYRPNSMMNTSALDIMHESDWEHVTATFQEARDSPGKANRTVFRIRHQNGHWIWMEANGRFEEQADGLKAYYNVRDIQKEHQNESELRKLSLVANRTSNSVIITDAEQNIEWVNSSFTALSGYSLKEAKGKYLPSLLHGPLSRNNFNQVINRLLKSRKPFRSENVNYSKSGKHYWIESIVTPVMDAEGNLTNYISIETDISQRKQEEDTFRNYLKVITKQNETLRNLAHIITHNFRSHAGNINQLLKELERENNPEEMKTIHHYLSESSESLIKGLRETSDFLNENSENLPIEDCDLNACIKRVEQLLFNDVRKINADIRIKVPKEQTIRAYSPYLDSVLFNLISNALRYNDPQKDPYVEIRSTIQDEFICLEVEDNGLGIDLKKYGDRIFKLRQSFHNHPESSGIGLYMIRAQIESLGGEIEVESKPGFGSIFKARFPK